MRPEDLGEYPSKDEDRNNYPGTLYIEGDNTDTFYFRLQAYEFRLRNRISNFEQSDIGKNWNKQWGMPAIEIEQLLLYEFMVQGNVANQYDFAQQIIKQCGKEDYGMLILGQEFLRAWVSFISELQLEEKIVSE